MNLYPNAGDSPYVPMHWANLMFSRIGIGMFYVLLMLLSAAAWGMSESGLSLSELVKAGDIMPSKVVQPCKPGSCLFAGQNVTLIVSNGVISYDKYYNDPRFPKWNIDDVLPAPRSLLSKIYTDELMAASKRSRP